MHVSNPRTLRINPRLFSRCPRRATALQAHAEFRRVMREKGVRVLTVREILAFGTADHVGARLELEEFAMLVGAVQVLFCTKGGGGACTQLAHSRPPDPHLHLAAPLCRP